MTVRGTGNASARMPQAVACSAAAEAAALAHFDSGDGLIDRATGRNLHDKKVNGDDRPQGGDNQQQSAN
ncbi:hypothetical protein D3C71_1901660 [compost metagenome]